MPCITLWLLCVITSMTIFEFECGNTETFFVASATKYSNLNNSKDNKRNVPRNIAQLNSGSRAAH